MCGAMCLYLQIISITSLQQSLSSSHFRIHILDATRTILPCILTRHDNDWWHQNMCGLNARQARISIRNIVYYSALLILLEINGGATRYDYVPFVRVCVCVLPFRDEQISVISSVNWKCISLNTNKYSTVCSMRYTQWRINATRI